MRAAPTKGLGGALAFAALLLAPAAGAAGPVPPEEAAWRALAPYRPEAQVAGTIRLWGHGSPRTDFARRLVTRWERGFAAFQPQVRFDYRMYGTASAIGALYAGAGDLAIMGEEIFPAEETAYEEARHHPPASVEIATGSLDVRNFDFAQVFFVHRDNPMRALTLAQLDAVFGTEHRRGEPRNFRTWGDLGLTGGWADRPIHLYGWSLDNDFWIYLDQAVLGGSHRINGALHEYAHIYRPDGTIYDAGQQILEALARDPDGIAVSNLRYANPLVRPLALAASAGEPACAATKANLISRRYPLTRIIPAVFNREPGGPVDPAVKEFLRYLLSREGQRDIAEDGEYLPLDPAAARKELAALDQAGTDPLRIWGADKAAGMLRLWEAGFRREHPAAVFENRLLGTDTGIAGLYTGKADLAFLGRDITPVETMAFSWVFRRPPAAVEVMTGSVDVPGLSPALAVLVPRDNPIAGFTLAQLAGIFGAGGDLGTWGRLGLGGEWADRPVDAYARDTGSAAMDFFRTVVLQGSRKWNWDRLREFRDEKRPDGSLDPADERIAAALHGDPGGIGIGDLCYAGADLRAVPLAAEAGGPYYAPTRKNLIERRYPLTRDVRAYFNRAPGKPVDPKVAAFLDYVLSPEGQAEVARAGGYLPLSDAASAAERAKLP